VDGNADSGALDGDWKKCIGLGEPTIGLIYSEFLKQNFRDERIFAMPDLDEDEADKKEDEEEKPSTSKKRRIYK